jgi:hypothetical protein
MAKQKRDFTQAIIDAHPRCIELATEIAIRTQTSLILNKNGKIVSVKPPFKYVLVPAKAIKKTSKK